MCDIETLFISLSQTESILSKINPIPPNKNYWSLITTNVATFVIYVQRDNNIFVKITKIYKKKKKKDTHHIMIRENIRFMYI